MTYFSLAVTVFIPSLWAGSMAVAATAVKAAWNSPVEKYGTIFPAINATVIFIAVAFAWTQFLAWVFLKWGAF